MPAIRRLLVANRGEIARRIIRAAHELGIETVAVYAEGDAEAPFVREAGTAVSLAGRTATETYLDGGAIIEGARRTRADAVHPGYGFLSENAAFAREVRGAGLIFVGPSSEAIALLGDKIAAARHVAAAGVPVLESVVVEEGVASSESLGSLDYPVMVKAAAGGGGRGMRIVSGPEELEEALAAAGREALAAFGDGRLFIEPYLARARHVEVQIFGDSAGNLVHCFERECSIQRRHQKIIEEAPSSAVSPQLRQEMGAAAIRAVSGVGYENAGTVEFLLAEDGRFFFLEVNARIQVEHPVTEAVTGLDLVREQLLVAGGEALSFSQEEVTLRGHAIEARLYAEDPRTGFLPAAGRVGVWRPASEPAVRYDSGVEEGSVVGTEFDPMLAKVIAHAPSRSQAAARLALALDRTAVHGLVTNRDFLVSVLRDEAFLAGETTTAFIEERSIDAARAPTPEEFELAAVVAALSEEQHSRAAARVLSSLPSGWRMSVMPPERRRYGSEAGELTVEYSRLRDGTFDMVVLRGTGEEGAESSSYLVCRHGGPPEAPDLSIAGLRPRVRVASSGEKRWIDFVDGASVELLALARFPERENVVAAGGLVAPMPGRVLSVHATAGEKVEAGQLLVIVEAMKMEHRITAPEPGVVLEVRAVSGEQVSSGDLLVSIEPAGTSAES